MPYLDYQANASRQCMMNGQWLWNSNINNTWSNYSQCYRNTFVTILVDLPENEQRNNDILIKVNIRK